MTFLSTFITRLALKIAFTNFDLLALFNVID
jgi:hypothetical protein